MQLRVTLRSPQAPDDEDWMTRPNGFSSLIMRESRGICLTVRTRRNVGWRLPASVSSGFSGCACVRVGVCLL